MEESHGQEDLASVRARFDAKTRWADEPHPVLGTKCLLWTGGLRNKFGYGGFRFRGRMRMAHDVAREMETGPDGKKTLHKCDVRLCVNLEHLFPGTQADNVRDMMAKGRHCAPRGEAHGMTHLTESDVLSIRREHAAGESYGNLAAKHGVSRATVKRIDKRKSWAHVPQLVRLAMDSQTPGAI